MSEDFFMLLLKAWKVSDSVSDDDFRKAIIAEYFRSTTKLEDKALPLAYIEYAYEQVNVVSMRVFIIVRDVHQVGSIQVRRLKSGSVRIAWSASRSKTLASCFFPMTLMTMSWLCLGREVERCKFE
jgi:hypothetical protein